MFFLQNKDKFPRMSITIFAIVIAAVSLMLPVLRAKLFIFSPQMMMCYGLLLSLWLLSRLDVKSRLKTILYSGAIILCLAAAGLIVQRASGSHSHVYNLILGKIKYMGQLPLDAAKLPYETKVMWTSAFTSPSLQEIWLSFLGSLALGAVAVAWFVVRFFRGKAGRAEIMAVYFACTGFVLFLMIRRMDVFAVFFVAVTIGSLVLVKGRLLKLSAYLCIAGAFFFSIYYVGRINLIAVRPTQEYVQDVIGYIKAKARPGEAVLTLHPSLGLVRSSYPIVSIFEANAQSGAALPMQG